MIVTETLRKAMTEVRPMPIYYTVDDLEFMPDDTNRYEIIGGKLFVSNLPHIDHQLLISTFIFSFGKYLDKNPLGKIIPTPGVIFAKDEAVIPDLVFATNETIEKNVAGEGKQFDGKFIAAPDLVVEILSLGKKDVERDRVFKRELYGNHGVKNIG